MSKAPYVFLAACVAAAGIWYVRHPEHTKIPDEATPVASVRPQLEKLPLRDRILVAGYLLRQRGEAPSLPMRDNGPFTARNFGEAIKLQKAFLDARFYTPISVIRVGLEDGALKPLREVVELTGMEATTTTRREIYAMHPQSSTRYGGPEAVAEEDKPVFKATYFLRNLTDAPVEVTGVVEVRKANPARSEVGSLTSCFFKEKAIAPRMSIRVDCANPQRTLIPKEEQELLDSKESDRLLIWTPGEIRFADGRTLKYNADAATRHGKLWGFYGLEYVD